MTKSDSQSLAKRLVLLLVVFALVMVLWNIPTVTNISKPTVNSVIAAIKPTPSPSYDGNKDAFYYPRLGIDAPMSNSPATSPLNSADWNSIRSALTKGVSLNYTADSLDKAKLAYVTGHSSDTYPHAYSSVFAGLGQANEGDEFILTGGGEVRRYTVTDKQIVNPTNVLAFSEAGIAADSGGQRVIVVTCWPLLTTTNRLIIVGQKL